MAEIKHIFIVCGEPSGDLNAAKLVHEIKRINPNIRFSGVGGQLLRQEKVELFYDIRELSVIGLFDVLKKLPLFLRLRNTILNKIKSERPDAIIFVDFSGFNLRLAKSIKKKIPTIYYTSPQVWASRAGRIKTIKKYIDKMLVFFKFEREFYANYSIDADFIGHPLLDIVYPTKNKAEIIRQLGLSERKFTIALLPGSRKQEIKHILPIMLGASKLIEKKVDAQFIIVKPTGLEKEIYEHCINKSGVDAKIAEGQTYDCLNTADLAIVASGTATLETAIMQKPFVIVYKMSLLNYLLYRPQVKLPYIGMVNIISGRMLIPEFIQFKANPRKIALSIIEIMEDPLRMEYLKQGLLEVKNSLGEKGAAGNAARTILEFLKRPRN